MKDLLGDGVSVCPTRHRAEPAAAGRVKVAAGAAVAASALIGATDQVGPALAQAAPLLSGVREAADTTADAVELHSATEPAKETEATTPPAVSVELPVASEVVPTAAPISAPFGLNNLPPEVADPLAHAEQVLKQLQQQVVPAPAVRPVAGVVSSGFGSRWGAFHYGVDFADQLGSPIHSVMGGTVIEAGPASGFGQWVRVKQDDATTAVYGHVNDMYVQPGQRVNTGDVIASVGNRGQSTGPHLHLEIWDAADNKIDPSSYLAGKGVVMQQQWGPGR